MSPESLPPGAPGPLGGKALSTPPDNRIARPLYTIDGIVIGTLLGSLIAGIYMMMSNYLAFGSGRLARQTLIGGMGVFALVLLASWAAPPGFLFALVFALGQALLAYLLAGRLQGTSIRYYAERGTQVHGLFRSALVGLLAGALSLIVVLLLNAILSI